jgi:signal transduction histidine kinase
MLRRKLLIVFGSLVILLAVMAVSGVWMMQGVLQRLDHISTEAVTIVDKSTSLNATLTAVEIDLYQLQLDKKHHLDALMDNVEAMRALIVGIGEHYFVGKDEIKPVYRKLQAASPAFERAVGSLATAQDPTLAKQYNVEALSQAMAMREQVRTISQEARGHAREEQTELVEYFRWLVLGMAMAFLLVINVSIIVLLRGARMVLKPMQELVEGGRQLVSEQFGHRTHLDRNDEFSELADVHNYLAERVQAHEHERMETIKQIARTLNHELNNAMATIELQLEVIGKQANGDTKFEKRLHQIRESLKRMAGIVESFKNIRRIVLTDYISGVKMLDIDRSTAVEQDEKPNHTDSEQV